MYPIQRFFFVLAAVIAVQFVQCGGGNEGEVSRCEGDFPADRIVYADDVASDEAAPRVWDKLCEATPRAGAADLVSPASGAVVPRSELELVWDQTLARAPAAGGPARAVASAPAQLPLPWLGVQRAAAHLPPVTGWVYLVELRPPAGASLWIFTVERSWRPDLVRQAEMPLGTWTVRITSAWLDRNVVVEGPWQGAEHTFELVEG